MLIKGHYWSGVSVGAGKGVGQRDEAPGIDMITDFVHIPD